METVPPQGDEMPEPQGPDEVPEPQTQKRFRLRVQAMRVCQKTMRLA